MPWTDDDRDYFFGNRENFEKRYCRDDKVRTLANERIIQGYLSRLIFKLTCVLPALSHRSPNWTAKSGMPHPQKPIVVMGTPKGEKIIRKNRCGLCEFDGRIYFWVDADNALFSPEQAHDWKMWRTGPNGDQQYLYDKPVSPDIVPDVAVLAIMGRLNGQHGGDSFTVTEASQLWLREPANLKSTAGETSSKERMMVPRKS